MNVRSSVDKAGSRFRGRCGRVVPSRFWLEKFHAPHFVEIFSSYFEGICISVTTSF